MTRYIKERKVVTMTYRVHTTDGDIENSALNDGCRNPHLCMERLANLRALIRLLGEGKVERVRLDGAQIKYIFGGYRWAATTPKVAKVSLIRFDHILNQGRKKVTPELIAELKKKIKPHSYTVVAYRGTKIQKVTAERQHQINEARRARHLAGLPGPEEKPLTLRDRVIGLGAV